MQKTVRTKPYKACSPYETINKIRNILFNHDIFLLEKHHFSDTQSYSCRLTITGNDLEKLNKGTNGKGLTPLYSLASAYAEFMERIQNYYIFHDLPLHLTSDSNTDTNKKLSQKSLDKNISPLEFEIDPDEKYLSLLELNHTQDNIIKNIAAHNKYVDLECNDRCSINRKCLFVPFYCVMEKEIQYLPIQLFQIMTGSNGMCAGNTKEEALIQGFCEIFERYVAKQIYHHELTPPTIPKDCFKDTYIYKLLNDLEQQYNISVIIKDCSLGVGLPVVGLLLIHHDSNTYSFKLGAALSPIIALERCFTEAYQGNCISDCQIKIDFSNNIFNNLTDDISTLKNKELLKYVTKGNGILPYSILSDDFSYNFEKMNYNLDKNDKEDLLYIINLIKSLGFNAYIRNVSFLDFPSFYIYIPGMSEVVNPFPVKEKEHVSYKRNEFNPCYLYNLRDSTEEKYKIIAEFLKRKDVQEMQLFPYNVSDNNIVDKYYLLALIYYRISNFRESHKYINAFIETLDRQEMINTRYLCCIRNYIYFRSEGKSSTEISNILKDIYDHETLHEIIKVLNDPINIFNHQTLPTCFDCFKCELSNQCLYLHAIEFMKKIQAIHMKHKSSQMELMDLFSSLN